MARTDRSCVTVMKFESYPGDRIEWVMQQAQAWLQADLFTDLSITCGGAGGRRFRCHKIMFHHFLRQFLSPEMVEEVEDVVIPHLDPSEFKKYHSSVYGLDSSGELVVNTSAVDVKVKLEEADYDETEYFDGAGYQEEEDEEAETKITLKSESEDEDSGDEDKDDVDYIEYAEKLGKKTKPRQKYRIKCRLCFKEFSDGQLKGHFLKYHPDEEYISPAKQRKLDGVNKKDFTCKQCDLPFVSYRELQKHRKTVHYYDKRNSEEVTCDICGKTKKKHNYAAHKRSHLLELQGNIVCSCGQKFSREIEFYQHKYEEGTGGEDHCVVTDNTLPKHDSSSDYFQKHKESYLPCDRCHEAFATKFLLRRHKLDTHWEELRARDMLYKEAKAGVFRIKNFSCDFENCDKYFRELQDKEVHMARVHTGVMGHQCDQCIRAFASAKKLRIHIRNAHEVSDDPVICQECGESFKNKEKLRVHWNQKHTKKKSLQCKFCDYSTTAAAQLREHERTHTGEKPETCAFCGQGFSSKRTRENHERLHTGEKPYACRYCDQAFVQRTSVNVHVQTHHKAEVTNAGPKEKHFVFTKPPKEGQRGRPANYGQNSLTLT